MFKNFNRVRYVRYSSIASIASIVVSQVSQYRQNLTSPHSLQVKIHYRSKIAHITKVCAKY